MYHCIEFRADCLIDVETGPDTHLQRTRVRRGTRLSAAVRPYVCFTDHGPVEMANLCLADGTLVREVPYELFAFVD
jgi:hypothetical protein